MLGDHVAFTVSFLEFKRDGNTISSMKENLIAKKKAPMKRSQRALSKSDTEAE